MNSRQRMILLIDILFCLLLICAALSLINTQISNAQQDSELQYFPILINEHANRGLPSLLISEVLYDPENIIKEPDGEWVELFNPGVFDVQLDTYMIGDAEFRGAQEGMYRFPTGAMIHAGEVVVIANRSAMFSTWGGMNPTFEFVNTDPAVPDMIKVPEYAAYTISLSNQGDEVLLLDADFQIVDQVSWGSSYYGLSPPVERVPPGFSIERWPAYHDSDQRLDWRIQSQPAPFVVDLQPPTPLPSRTPTATITPTPTNTFTPTITPTKTLTPTPEPAGHLLISEVYYDQQGTIWQVDWFELFNPKSVQEEVGGFKVGDARSEDDASDRLYLLPEDLFLEPGQLLLVAKSGQNFYGKYRFYPDYELENTLPFIPDLEPDPLWGQGTFALDPVDDELLLLDQNDQLVDAVSWGLSDFAFGGFCPNVGPGKSEERFPAFQDTDHCSDWREQPAPNPGLIP